jgi:hypothetical protein
VANRTVSQFAFIDMVLLDEGLTKRVLVALRLPIRAKDVLTRTDKPLRLAMAL